MSNVNRAGIVLAGGYSTRFGEREKALAKLNGRPLLVSAVERLAHAVDNVVINCRRDQLSGFRSAVTSVSTDIEFVCDSEPDKGPAAGLATALGTVSTPSVAVVACDMPFVDATFLEWLFAKMNGSDGAVPYLGETPQPTHAVYATKPTQRAANNAVTTGSGSLRDMLAQLDLAEIPEARLLEETSETSFVDINTPEELESASATQSDESPR